MSFRVNPYCYGRTPEGCRFGIVFFMECELSFREFRFFRIHHRCALSFREYHHFGITWRSTMGVPSAQAVGCCSCSRPGYACDSTGCCSGCQPGYESHATNEQGR